MKSNKMLYSYHLILDICSSNSDCSSPKSICKEIFPGGAKTCQGTKSCTDKCSQEEFCDAENECTNGVKLTGMWISFHLELFITALCTFPVSCKTTSDCSNLDEVCREITEDGERTCQPSSECSQQCSGEEYCKPDRTCLVPG